MKFELSLLSQAESFVKIRQFSWSDSKNSIFSISTSWNFRKNILDLMQSLENLNCRYY